MSGWLPRTSNQLTEMGVPLQGSLRTHEITPEDATVPRGRRDVSGHLLPLA